MLFVNIYIFRPKASKSKVCKKKKAFCSKKSNPRDHLHAVIKIMCYYILNIRTVWIVIETRGSTSIYMIKVLFLSICHCAHKRWEPDKWRCQDRQVWLTKVPGSSFRYFSFFWLCVFQFSCISKCHICMHGNQFSCYFSIFFTENKLKI